MNIIFNWKKSLQMFLRIVWRFDVERSKKFTNKQKMDIWVVQVVQTGYIFCAKNLFNVYLLPTVL